MEILWGSETLFKDERVFDADFLPDLILHRERQINKVVSNLKPAVRGHAPVNMLCLGPPSTGKTTVVRHVVRNLDEFENIATVYIRCPTLRTEYNIVAKIYEVVCKRLAPQKGIAIAKMQDEICMRLLNENKTLIIVFDDMNFINDEVVNNLLYNFLKVGDYLEIKIGLICIVTDVRFVAKLDPATGAVFHFDEVYFPVYGEDEIKDILRWRVERGFHKGVVSEEAFDKIVRLTAKSGDLRLGLYLLKMSGLEAERKAKRKIDVEDVEAVYEGGAKVFLIKSISALNSDEREVLKIIYMLDNPTTGKIYRMMNAEVGMYYERFYEIIDKLERLKLIDVVFGKKGRGRTRYLVKRYDPDIVLEAMRF